MTLQYLIDENVNPIYPQQIRRQELSIVVKVIGELPQPRQSRKLSKSKTFTLPTVPF